MEFSNQLSGQVESDIKVAFIEGESGKNKINYTVTEGTARVREANYHSIFEQASDAIFVTDYKGNFIDVNNSLCGMFGYDKETLLKLNIAELIDREQLKANPIDFNGIANGKHVLSNRKMVTKSGDIREVEANVKRCGDNMILAIVRDVTELRKAQRLTLLSEARFRGAFEHSAIGMALVSLNGEWLKVNRELCSIVGYTEQELLSMTFQDITHKDDLGKDIAFLKMALDGEIEFYRIEKRYIHKNGTLLWVNLSVSLIKDSHSKPSYFVSQIENITERKRSEAALKKSEANMRAIFETTDTAYAMIDNELNIVSYNKYAADFTLNEVGLHISPGVSLSDFFREERKPHMEQVIPKVLNGEYVNYETAFPQPDGSTHWYYVRLYPVSGSEKEVFGLMLAIDNITKRKQDELQKEQFANVIVSRNKDLEEFAHILSHNVRSHVARIMGLTNLLVDYDIDEAERMVVISGISQSANELDTVVRDLNNIVQFRNNIQAN